MTEPASNLIPQIPGVFTRMAIGEEVTPGVDTAMTAAFLPPLNADSTFMAQDENIEVPAYTGDRTNNAQIYGMTTAQGNAVIDWDFVFAMRDFIWHFGRGMYSRPWGASIGLHRLANTAGLVSQPSFLEIENQFAYPGATTEYVRHRAVLSDSLGFKHAPKGPMVFTQTFMGSGDWQPTSMFPSPISAYTSDGPFVIASSQNTVIIANALATRPSNFSVDFKNVITREDAASGGPTAAALNADKANASGQIDVLYANSTYAGMGTAKWNTLAKAQTPIVLEWWVFNGPTGVTTGTAGWTAFYHFQMWINPLATTPTAGGGKGRQTSHKFFVNSGSAANFGGEIFSTVPGPYVLPATPALGLKPNGGGTVTIPLTGLAGSQTAATVAAALNADTGAGHFAEKMVASVVAQGLRIQSLLAGPSASVQVDGTIGSTAHTALGLVPFVATSQAGLSQTALIIDLYNPVLTATY